MALKTYECELCRHSYLTFEDAFDCEAKGVDEHIVVVGDIVLCRAGFGWFDGDKQWVENPDVKRNLDHGNCFYPCCTMQFFHVVTAVDTDRLNGHRTRYHLFTKAMTGGRGYASGYTYKERHYPPRKVVDPPEFVVTNSRDLIGKLANSLI